MTNAMQVAVNNRVVHEEETCDDDEKHHENESSIIQLLTFDNDPLPQSTHMPPSQFYGNIYKAKLAGEVPMTTSVFVDA